MNLISPKQIAELTPDNTYDRFPDGRPRVPDDILERMRKVTTEEAYTPGEVDRKWSEEMEADFAAWKKSNKGAFP